MRAVREGWCLGYDLCLVEAEGASVARGVATAGAGGVAASVATSGTSVTASGTSVTASRAFAGADPVPVAVVGEIGDLDLEGDLCVITPQLARPVDVALVDAEGREATITLGTRRLARRPWERLANAWDQGPLEALIARWKAAGSAVRVREVGVFPKGDGYVVRFAVSAETRCEAPACEDGTVREAAEVREDDAVREIDAAHEAAEERKIDAAHEAVAARARERLESLSTLVLDSQGRPAPWTTHVMEDAMVADGDRWHRETVLSVEVPAGAGPLSAWAYAPGLKAGDFEALAAWMLDSRANDFRRWARSAGEDDRYDGLVRAREAECSVATADTLTMGAWPRLRVFVAEDPWGARAVGSRRVRQRLARTRASLDAQTYRGFDWEFVDVSEPLGAAAARHAGEWRVVVGAGDELAPDALARLAEAAAGDGTILVYGDEDVLARGLSGPRYEQARLKPRFSVDELYCGNGVGLPMAVGPAVDVTEAMSAYDLALSALEAGGEAGVRHIEAPLLHACEPRPIATLAAVESLDAHLARRGLAASACLVESGERGYLRVHYAVPREAPLVSIVVPNRDHASYLERCVTSILERTTWPRFEVVVVENGSVEPATTELYRRLKRDERVRVVSWRGRRFNYSAVVNRGVEKSEGEIVCLLNNDTEVLDGRWLEELVGPLGRSEVGITGALLSFEDGLVQHAGILCLPDGSLGHMEQNLWPADDTGYLLALRRPMAFSALTGACQAVRRETFEAVGGYDKALAVGFNDADFCLKVRALGKESLLVPQARLMHREFGTRHREATDPAERERWERERALMARRHPEYFGARDPMLNAALDPYGRYFGLALEH